MKRNAMIYYQIVLTYFSFYRINYKESECFFTLNHKIFKIP